MIQNTTKIKFSDPTLMQGMLKKKKKLIESASQIHYGKTNYFFAKNKNKSSFFCHFWFALSVKTLENHLFVRVVVALGTRTCNLSPKAEILTALRCQFVGASLHTDVTLAASFHLFLGKASLIFLCNLGAKGGAVVSLALCLKNSEYIRVPN